jgi:cytochrome b pre-mRNA-processing protein 3
LHVSNDGGKTVIFESLFGRKKPDPSEALYGAIVAAARQEKFYADMRVPDTLDGRFDMMALHMYLVLDRLREFGAEAETFRQALTDRFFAAMDQALREVGVGDLVVGKKVRKMAEAYFGRVTAYASAAASGDEEMRDALARNVYAGVDAAHAMDLAKWSRHAKQVLSTQNFKDIKSGQLRFEV